MSTGNSAHTQHINAFPSLEVAFDLTRERITHQLEQVGALDTKASFIVGASTAFVSAALVLEAVLLPISKIILINKAILTNKVFQSFPILSLLSIYLIVLITAFLAYNVRNFKRVPNPQELYEYYLDKPEHSTKAEIFRAMVEAFKINENKIRKKVLWTKISLVLLGCEAVALILFLVYQVVL